MSIKSGKIEGFEQFSQFSSLKEFNTHMEMWLALHKHDFAKGELVGLKRLIRFSAKVPGVSNAKIGTILKAIHEEYNANGISRSTFKRMVQKAISLGILTIHETERKNGSQSSNLYIFNRFPKNEPPKDEKMNHPETIILSKQKDQDINKRKEERAEQNHTFEHAELNHTFTSDKVPQPFVQLAKCFFNNAKTIQEYWQMVQIAAYRNNRETETDTVLDTAISSFKQLIGKIKSNTRIKNQIAYFYGIIDTKFTNLFPLLPSH
ncbi:hypothetical protein D1B31_04860 [Neobacillus notoginsengisoli]|uniref:Helix-turn-helix domain-containing protein n=1 Tax=Neobacillus notoginsengisoli TaxID=1578198 RepID=A0A417YWV8_9BACI|nr:hypothetical protein [Neobacillus notoginsengisoli]RHW41978.1 hypothetical protein D1B31_04860 [Neobacillus notoginsengisoli]